MYVTQVKLKVQLAFISESNICLMESNQSAQDLFTGYFKEIDTKKIAVVGASLAVACASAYYLFSPKS